MWPRSGLKRGFDKCGLLFVSHFKVKQHMQGDGPKHRVLRLWLGDTRRYRDYSRFWPRQHKLFGYLMHRTTFRLT